MATSSLKPRVETTSNSAPSTLDTRFGPACSPTFNHEAERTCLPRSLQRLDAQSGPALRVLMELAHTGLAIASLTSSSLPILWAVDEDGVVWFAMEEVVSQSDSQFMYALPRAFALPDGHVKLGHPCLISGRKGRIAGELVYDPDFGDHGWVISNKSGRFGFGDDRVLAHLENVAAEFGVYGIELDVYYIPPEPEEA